MPASKPRRPKPAGPNAVLGLDHVVLRVRDIAASIDFYKRVLGARVERQLQKPRIVQLRIGASLLDLVPGRAGRGAGANLDHFAVRVARFDPAALARRLARFGIETGPAAERYGAEGYGPSVYFRDPDGNTIEFKGPAVRPRIRR
ncbi:MAG: VOC family protein [Proteobacteria bacterium]|nr:VOC family protein [Pseudomonadota bacterium]